MQDRAQMQMMRRQGQRRGGRYGEDQRVYEKWMEKEGIPVYEAFGGIEDITELPRRPWARLGGSATFIELEGTKQARKLLYVAEIPGGGALEPERHLYDELIYIIQGRGLAEVWYEKQGKRKHTFEWGEGSLFAIPFNAWHRLANGGREPVLFLAQTSAPIVINALRDTEFIFNCDYDFPKRDTFAEAYTGEDDYFHVREKQPGPLVGPWETNFIADVRTCFLGDHLSAGKVEGGLITGILMGGWSQMHASEWPTGKYHKAHYHGPGAILLGLRGMGYVLMWHGQYGIHPFQDGHGDKVEKLNWKRNSIYSPPSEWFHQHLNTGLEPARHLATTGGGLSIELPTLEEKVGKKGGLTVRGANGTVQPWLTVIEYEDEDPEIRRMFLRELRQNGIECTMEPVVYRS